MHMRTLRTKMSEAVMQSIALFQSTAGFLALAATTWNMAGAQVSSCVLTAPLRCGLAVACEVATVFSCIDLNVAFVALAISTSVATAFIALASTSIATASTAIATIFAIEHRLDHFGLPLPPLVPPTLGLVRTGRARSQ